MHKKTDRPVDWKSWEANSKDPLGQPGIQIRNLYSKANLFHFFNYPVHKMCQKCRKILRTSGHFDLSIILLYCGSRVTKFIHLMLLLNHNYSCSSNTKYEFCGCLHSKLILLWLWKGEINHCQTMSNPPEARGNFSFDKYVFLLKFTWNMIGCTFVRIKLLKHSNSS